MPSGGSSLVFQSNSASAALLKAAADEQFARGVMRIGKNGAKVWCAARDFYFPLLAVCL